MLVGLLIRLSPLLARDVEEKDPWPRRSYQLSRPHYRIETVFSQLVERFQAKQVWARDIRHLQARLLRKLLSHTLTFSLNQEQGNPPLQFDKLLAWYNLHIGLAKRDDLPVDSYHPSISNPVHWQAYSTISAAALASSRAS